MFYATIYLGNYSLLYPMISFIHETRELLKLLLLFVLSKLDAYIKESNRLIN